MSLFKTILLTAVFFVLTTNTYSQLGIISPNGGEVFNPGEKILIQWEGVNYQDTVALLYSLDKGTSWNKITNIATGLEHEWLVPDEISAECLLKVVLYNRDAFCKVQSKIIGPPTAPSMLASWNEDRSKFFSLSNGACIKIWDIDNNKVLQSYTIFDGAIVHSDINQDKNQIVYACTDHNDLSKSIRIWDLNSSEEICAIQAEAKKVKWSPDGEFIASIDTNVRIWDAESGALYQTLYDNSTYICDLEWNNDGSKILSADTNYVRVWDTQQWICTDSIKVNLQLPRLCRIAWAPDGRKFALTDDIKVKVYDINEKIFTDSIENEGFSGNFELSWSPSGKYLIGVMAMHGCKYWMWDIGSGSDTINYFSIQNYEYWGWTSQGDTLISGAQSGDIELFNIPDRELKSRLGYQFALPENWSCNNSDKIAIKEYNNISIYNPVNGDNLANLPANPLTFCWGPKDDIIVSVSYNSTDKTYSLIKWDSEQNILLDSIPLANDEIIHRLLHSNQDDNVAGITLYQDIMIWDTDGLNLVDSINKMLTDSLKAGMNIITFSPDLNLIYFSYDNITKVWDRSIQAFTDSMVIAKENESYMDFDGNPYNEYISVSRRGDSRIFCNFATKAIKSYDIGQIDLISWHTDGKTMLAVNYNNDSYIDSKLLLIDIMTGNIIDYLPLSIINSGLYFSNDGNYIAVLDPNGDIVIYSLEMTELKSDISDALWSIQSETDVEFRAENNINLNVYPNPANNRANIEFVSEYQGEAEIVVTNILGDEVFSSIKFFDTGVNVFTWQAGNIPDGIYYVKVIFDGKSYVSKLIISKE